MTFPQHVRVAGAVVCIVSYFIGNMGLNMIGFCIMAFGLVLHIDNLERRLKALESKEPQDERL